MFGGSNCPPKTMSPSLSAQSLANVYMGCVCGVEVIIKHTLVLDRIFCLDVACKTERELNFPVR